METNHTQLYLNLNGWIQTRFAQEQQRHSEHPLPSPLQTPCQPPSVVSKSNSDQQPSPSQAIHKNTQAETENHSDTDLPDLIADSSDDETNPKTPDPHTQTKPKRKRTYNKPNTHIQQPPSGTNHLCIYTHNPNSLHTQTRNEIPSQLLRIYTRRANNILNQCLREGIVTDPLPSTDTHSETMEDHNTEPGQPELDPDNNLSVNDTDELPEFNPEYISALDHPYQQEVDCLYQSNQDINIGMTRASERLLSDDLPNPTNPPNNAPPRPTSDDPSQPIPCIMPPPPPPCTSQQH
jgi:hypothetical protein